jgi:DNA polymerase III epsilon subunit-like protein
LLGVFIDTETGGLDPKVHALTQVAAIAFEIEPGSKPVIREVYQTYVQPSKWMAVSPGALEIQHSSLQMLQDAGTPEVEVYHDLLDFLEKHLGTSDSWGGRIWAQEAAFDHGFLRALEKRVGDNDYFSDRCDWNCTKRLWTLLRFLGVHDEPKTSLKNIIAYYGIRGENEQTHDATDDAVVALEALGMMLNNIVTKFSGQH